MNKEELAAIFIGVIIIAVAISALKSVITWLYETFKVAGRIGVGIAGMVTTQIITQSIFGIGFSEITLSSIGTGIVLAFLFPSGMDG